MRRGLLILIIGLIASSVQASGSLCRGGPPSPWPFANNCPFPWSEIEGLWEVKPDEQIKHHFEFTLVPTDKPERRVFEIRQYDYAGVLIAKGRGVSPDGQRVIRAALRTINDLYPKYYWVYMGRYVEENKHSCIEDKVYTVVTIRQGDGDPDTDQHYIVEKNKGWQIPAQ